MSGGNDLTDKPHVEPTESTPRTTDERLDSIEQTLKEIPDFMEKAFTEYDKRLKQSLQANSSGGSNLIGDVLGIVKQAVAPQGAGTDEISSLSRELITLNMRGMLREWQRKMGLVDHVSISHK